MLQEKNPIISIIVLVYNTEKYLRRCVDSILSQSFTDFELLLINDGSKDVSGKICDEYLVKDNRVRVFHKENGGVSSARNVGILNAKGEWITFVDSDDYVLDGYLQNFSSNINDKVDIVCQGMEFDRFFSKNNPIKQIAVDYHGNVKEGILELYKAPMPGSLCNKCFKNIIIKDYYLQFNETVVLREDEIFLLDYLKHSNKMVCIKSIGYYYFLPHWEEKYKCKSSYEIAKQIYKSQLIISNYSWNFMLLDSLHELTKQFIETFTKNKREIVLDYRECVGSNIKQSRLFVLSKWFIIMDITGYFSTALLKLHLILKTVLSRKRR